MHIIYIYINLIHMFRIHPYVIVEYVLDATNLVTIATDGTYQPINE
jgi:hypothetical protein